ncbi:MAG: glycogen debranching protein [Solirubrobacteraceae bacterium]
MRFKSAVGAGVVLATLAAGGAQAATPELSVGQRLEDRREVAAGTRAQVLGFQDGRFYANGWHITGEMGGIVTPPLKLLDSISFRVNDTWVPPATKFTSGAGYVRYAFPSVDGIGLRRTDVAPDRRRGALLGLELTNPKKNARTVNVFVDAHSELMTQYPWGFGGTVPNASENAPDRGAFDTDKLIFRDTGKLTGETAPHSYTAIVGSDRSPVNAVLGRGFYGPYGLGRRCAADSQAMPSACDDGPFGNGTGGRLHYRVRVPGQRSTTVWVAAAGSENSPAEARSEFRKLTADPAGLLARKRERRDRVAQWTQLDLPADRQLADSVEWGKQNLRDLTQVAEDVDLRWADEGKVWEPTGSLGRMRWIGAGFPDYPWLFGVDGEYTAHASVTLGQFGPIKDHMRALRDISDQLSDGSGVVVHEVVADGSIWHGKDSRTTNPETGATTYDFNTDEIVKFPAAVALIWRWTGDDAFRDQMLDFTARNLEYVRTELDEDSDGWPEGNGNVERPGMGEEKLDNAVYYIRALYDYADMASSAGQDAAAAAATSRADALLDRFEDEWWIEADTQYADSLGPAGEKINQKHWIGVDPMEAELWADGEVVPGLAAYANGSRALATRENDCYSGTRPGNRGLFHTGCGGGPTGAGEFAVFSLNTGIQVVGEGNYGRLGTEQQQRYTTANAETQFSEPATGGTPDEQPGAMPEIMPSVTPGTTTYATPPNIDRCWTCRSMFMQAWGHYGTSWAVVHQELGIRPSLGRNWLEVVPQLVDGASRASASNVRLGQGAADVHASRDGSAYTTKVDAAGVPGLETLWVGHTLPRDATVASVQLDGAPVTDYESRVTNRGLEVRVAADPGSMHTLVVTAG